MYKRAHHRAQRAGDRQKVQRHRKRHVEPDRFHHPLRQRHQVRKLLDLIVHQRDICRVHGDITARRAHRDADRRLFQSRRVIDAVSDHAHRASARFKFFDIPQLILRQTAGSDIVHMHLRRDRARRGFMVSCEQHRLPRSK